MMRLINTETLELEDFWFHAPPYAILSHTWGPEEVTYQDYIIATDPKGPENSRYNAIKEKAGFVKIYGSCSQAAKDGHKYLWCDTNCIDKTSSAELGEAINSMYDWYHDSAVCYAYLADIDKGDDQKPLTSSRWFTRGWTLQELLAPKEVVFFDKSWITLGTRKGLAEVISPTTLIHLEALHDRDTIPDFSIAQRMSWAAGRTTTRYEDIAYCLLGIFGINMSLIYGEGNNAFLRLQQKIIKKFNDHSIFAWDASDSEKGRPTSVFAPNPTNFQFCGSVVQNRSTGSGSQFALTNQGISIKAIITRMHRSNTIFMRLNCARELRGGLRTSESRTARPPQRFEMWLPLHERDEVNCVRIHNPVSKLHLRSNFQPISELPRWVSSLGSLKTPLELMLVLTVTTTLEYQELIDHS
ncbi:heterokaryon incompatibility protein-domain-containing protein [Xylariaceae sp. FL0255]|nr:heterokaryon incompatibility protein-domain-containing protein [Xylariaceae sp. FL0255]